MLEGKNQQCLDIQESQDQAKEEYARALGDVQTRFKAEAKEATLTLDDLARQIQDGQAALNRTVLEKNTRIEALKLEKGQLEGELSQAERRLAEQAQQYQQTIELTRAQSMEASALQMEHECAVKLNQEKDFEIAELKREREQMAADYQDTNEMLSTSVAGQKKLTKLLRDKDLFVETLKAKATEAQRELDQKEAQQQAREKVHHATQGLATAHWYPETGAPHSIFFCRSARMSSARSDTRPKQER
ncbi:hypothetical protein AAFF_G00348530 [Aldrovandia affinis]|uniref:Uncharacterized protein n=1 Tax=Aldrovandia affinis TaxID=143900 RepID=A0AAD7VZN7_9TELE|nr:hypothetical protein AAFF_G00348530 [Aldrovandia affinis]